MTIILIIVEGRHLIQVWVHTWYCLENGHSFSIKRTSSNILFSSNSLKLGIVVLVMFNKLLVIVYRFLPWIWAGIPKTQCFNLCPFLTLIVRNGPGISFWTKVPCNFNNCCASTFVASIHGVSHLSYRIFIGPKLRFSWLIGKF